MSFSYSRPQCEYRLVCGWCKLRNRECILNEGCTVTPYADLLNIQPTLIPKEDEQ